MNAFQCLGNVLILERGEPCTCLCGLALRPLTEDVYEKGGKEVPDHSVATHFYVFDFNTKLSQGLGKRGI